MVGCVEGILGLRPDLNGIRLAPSVPKDWESFVIDKNFRGKHLHITVNNPDHKESGFSALSVNGTVLEDNYIPEELLASENTITLTM